MFIPGQEGKKGVGGALGTIAGIGLSLIPGIGPGLAAALPAIGGATGSMFG
jgi:TctA family transporter